MEVMVAEHVGFCMGVRKAIKTALKQDRAYTLGPLIHNNYVIEKLEAKMIKKVDSIDEIEKGKIIIRAHGVPPSTIKKAQAKGLDVIDATCPFVKRVQDIACKLENKGYQVIIVGKEHHPEVIGVKGHANNAIVVETADRLRNMSHYKRIGIVAQTTQTIENFEAVVEEAEKHAKEIKVYNTICPATKQRQESAEKLAKQVDAMLVVGGHGSNNTRKLADICSRYVDTHQIEDESDVKEEWLKGKQRTGIITGTSTPDEVIERVINVLREIN